MKSIFSLLCLLTVLALSQEPQVEIAKAIPVTETKAPAPAPAPPEPETNDDSPVPLPPLSHFEPLWKDSMFTTKALPAPEVPAGPNFADNFSLSGTFEERGKMTAFLVDKTTSGFVQAYIGEDNEAGFRISKLELDEAGNARRIQLQKGTQTGWVSLDDGSTAASQTPLVQPGNAPNGPLASRPGMRIPAAQPVPQQLQPPPNIPRAEPFSSIPPVPQAETTILRGGMPAAQPSLPGDPPLPPQ